MLSTVTPVSTVTRLRAAPRCRSRSKRTKMPCRAPAVRGFRVCRFHGARGGAPRGNRNAWKHGTRGGAWRSEARALRALVRVARELVSDARAPDTWGCSLESRGGIPCPSGAAAIIPTHEGKFGGLAALRSCDSCMGRTRIAGISVACRDAAPGEGGRSNGCGRALKRGVRNNFRKSPSAFAAPINRPRRFARLATAELAQAC